MKIYIFILVLITWICLSYSQDGFATLGDGTTGGEGGEIVYVDNAQDLNSAVSGDIPRIIKIRGRIEISDWVRVGSNKSLLGVDTNSEITGAGIYIRRVRNVIIRGLKLSFPLAPYDAVSIDESYNVWIDHNEFFSSRDSDKDYYDGLLDMKHGADWVTISWNKFHNHWKSCLIGHSDSNEAEDRGHLTITFHHNYFLNFNSRLPSIRFGTSHIYNNLYYEVDSSGINSRMGAQVLVERNVFLGVTRPLVTNLDSNEDGFAIERDNFWGGSAPEITQEGTFDNPPYSYEMDELDNVPDIVSIGAGATIHFP